MKKKITLAIAAIMVLGIAVAAFAYTRTSGRAATAMSCCKGESCPMKNKEATSGEKASCCDNCDCCSGDSCPMKNGEASAATMKMGDAESCPLMKKAADGTEMKPEATTADAKSCCCSCCGNENKKKDAAAV